MIPKVRALGPTTTLIGSQPCIRAWDSTAGPRSTLSQLRGVIVEVAGRAHGAAVKIHGSRNLNADGARARAHHPTRSGSLSDRTKSQRHEGMLTSITLIPRSTALRMRTPQILRHGECKTPSPMPTERVRLRKVRAEDPHPRLGKGEVKVARSKPTRSTVDLTNTIPRPQHGTRLMPLFR
jgi:hypothetical protein